MFASLSTGCILSKKLLREKIALWEDPRIHEK
jgi:hypothetical protein